MAIHGAKENPCYSVPYKGGQLVSGHVIFDERDLEKIGIVCECGTESVFDLTKDQAANQVRECPGCGNREFLAQFVTEARQNYNWITYYKRVRDLNKRVTIRLYLKNPSV
jgi:hypothetical protein